MSEIVNLVVDWRSFVAVLIVLGVAPGLVLRAVVRLYPKSHPRRRELVAELYVVPYCERPLWVAQHFECALSEGLSARWRRRRRRWQEVMAATTALLGLFALMIVVKLEQRENPGPCDLAGVDRRRMMLEWRRQQLLQSRRQQGGAYYGPQP